MEATRIPCITWDNHIYQVDLLRISHTGVNIVYYDNRALFSSTSSQIYDKDKRKRVEVILFNKSIMDSNTLLFEPIKPKIGHKLSRPGSNCV